MQNNNPVGRRVQQGVVTLTASTPGGGFAIVEGVDYPVEASILTSRVNAPVGTPGNLQVQDVTPTSFRIVSSEVTDAAQVSWLIARDN